MVAVLLHEADFARKCSSQHQVKESTNVRQEYILDIVSNAEVPRVPHSNNVPATQSMRSESVFPAACFNTS